MGNEMKQEVATQSQFTTALSQYCNSYTDLVSSDFENRGLKFDNYSKECAMAAMSSIYEMVQSNDYKMEQINKSNLRGIIANVASLKLNANAEPRECYFSIRKKKVNGAYVPTIEMGIEGDGNDAMLRNFGVDVQKVYPVWLVKEGDEFTYPKHIGLDIQPPTWEPHGVSNRTVMVVYPVQLSDRIEYLMADRDSVKTNLIAHIKQNMMKETFGICADAYKANEQQKAEIRAKKQYYLNMVRQCENVEDAISNEELQKWISGAWIDTTEEMIVRKMRNNAIKKFPKSLNSIATQSLNEIDMTYQNMQQEIEENENKEDFIIDEPHTEEAVQEEVQSDVVETAEAQNDPF